MPGGFAGLPRDPTTNQPVGLARSFLSKPQEQPKASSSDLQAQSKTEGEASRPSLETLDSLAQQKQRAPSKSPFKSAMEKAKRRFSSSTSSGKDKDVLAGSEEEYALMKEQETEKERKKKEYERLGLDNKVKFGQGGWQMGN